MASTRSTSPWQEADLGFPRSLRFPICLGCSLLLWEEAREGLRSPFVRGVPVTNSTRRPLLAQAYLLPRRHVSLARALAWAQRLWALGLCPDSTGQGAGAQVYPGSRQLVKAPGRTGFPPTASAWS